MRIVFTPDGWADYQHWIDADRATLQKVNELIRDIRRDPFRGVGKPEPLRANLAGWWSRRITGEHRLVYRVSGQADDASVTISQCRFHYR
jgi:toxin YoeB